MNVKYPYYILEPLNKKEKVIDQRISYLIKDTLEGFMRNGVAGRKSAFLQRNDMEEKLAQQMILLVLGFLDFMKIL